jgi:hypothetical protein
MFRIFHGKRFIYSVSGNQWGYSVRIWDTKNPGLPVQTEYKISLAVAFGAARRIYNSRCKYVEVNQPYGFDLVKTYAW